MFKKIINSNKLTISLFILFVLNLVLIQVLIIYIFSQKYVQ